MRQIGDRRLLWRRAPRFAEYAGAATWQQRATLSVAVVGGLACAYLVVHLLGLEIRVPGLDRPEGTPAFVAAAPVPRHRLIVQVPAEVLTARPSAARPARVRPAPVTRSRRSSAPPRVQSPAPEAAAPDAPRAAPVPAPQPPAQAPAPPPQDPGASAPAPLVEAPIVPVAPAVPPVPSLPPLPPLPPLPELPLPSVEPVPVPVLPVALPTVP